MRSNGNSIRYIDLFCGIGGFRYGVTQVFEKYSIPAKCVFSSDIDPYAQDAYLANFGEQPFGDITKVEEHSIPDHDLLLAGFPCQPFSIIGNKKGFDDTRGTLFFDIARILEAKKPKAFILENVKQLVGHDKGKTLKRILAVLKDLGYDVHFKVLNALNYGLPQKRERIFIVGFYKPFILQWPPKKEKYKPLVELLEKNVDSKYFASERIKQKRLESHSSQVSPSIWHENKAGHISSYPFSCALRAGASYNYLLVNGERRLTPREMLRLQGFPDSFKVVVSEYQTRKQAGNAVPINLVRAVFESFLPVMLSDLSVIHKRNLYYQETLFHVIQEQRSHGYSEISAIANS
jgi:DNA (cytosine-5)-methyltransferase 1